MSHTPIQPDEPERAQQRRNQVLDAASECFRRNGFHGCSMAQLAKESGMSVGHIYHYFANKEAIIDAIVKRDLRECLDAIDQLMKKRKQLTDWPLDIAEHVDNALNSKNAALQFEILAEAARNPKVAEIVHEAHLHARAKVSELITMGSPKPLTPEMLGNKVEVIGALFDGLMVRAIRYPEINKAAPIEMMQSTMRHILDA